MGLHMSRQVLARDAQHRHNRNNYAARHDNSVESYTYEDVTTLGDKLVLFITLMMLIVIIGCMIATDVQNPSPVAEAVVGYGFLTYMIFIFGYFWKRECRVSQEEMETETTIYLRSLSTTTNQKRWNPPQSYGTIEDRNEISMDPPPLYDTVIINMGSPEAEPYIQTIG